jgi:hypothetical protein
MAICLSSLLMAEEAQVRLLTYRNKYTFNSVEYSPLMYKIIMRLATIDYMATMQTLRKNLQNIRVFAATAHGNINKIHGKFDRNHSKLLARSIALNDLIGLLFNSYLVVPCHNLKEYIRHHHDDWLSGKLIGMIHKTLMTFATCKCNYLKTRGTWGAKSPDNKKIMVMLLHSMPSRDNSSSTKSAEMI